MYEVTLVDCILKNTYNILIKDRTYDIKVRPHDWPLITKELIESINSVGYSFIALTYKEYRGTNGSCRAINRKILAHKNRAFHFNSMEPGKIYISSPIDNDKVILSDNLSGVRTLNKM